MKTRICLSCCREYTSKRCPVCTARASIHRERERQKKIDKCRKLAQFCRMSYVIKNEMVINDLADESHAEAVRFNSVRRYKERLRFYG